MPSEAVLDRMIARSVGVRRTRVLTVPAGARAGARVNDVENRRSHRRHAQVHGGEGGDEAAVLSGPTRLERELNALPAASESSSPPVPSELTPDTSTTAQPST